MATKIVMRQRSALKLRFQPGATGPAGDVTVGTTTTGAPGSSASVVNSGTPQHAILDFTVPRGDTGAPNTLTIGTVTTLPYGDPATASITGTAPNQTLDLGLPMGEQGPSGSVTDGDKGDIVVSAGGTVWTVDDDAITTAKIASGSLKALGGLTLAADKLAYGSGANAASLTDFTSFARTLLDDTTANAALQTLGAPWELVAQSNVSGSPGSVEFTGLSGTLEHRLLFCGIRPATDDTPLYLQVQTGGTTWQGSGYVYSGRMQGPGGGADTGSSLDSYTSAIILTRSGSLQGVGNASGEGVDGEISFVPADTSSRRRVRSSLCFTRSDGLECLATVAGAYGSPTAITGVRLLWGGGNFANVGKVALLRRVS